VTGDRGRGADALAWAAGALALTAAVVVIYRPALASYFFNDDFQWLESARTFDPANLLHLGRYDHFYRPIIEIYFYLGERLFGCAALPFHLVSLGIHLTNTLVLYLFARALTGNRFFAALTATLFCVQDGYVEAVAWVGAITDLLPALWYLVAMGLHQLFLRRRHVWCYAGTLAAFTACLLTHESSATLLALMLALEATIIAETRAPMDATSIRRRALWYVPFAVLLAGSLAITYVVNSRSYLIQEGHYRFGWHAVPHTLQYIISLYIGPRVVASYVAVILVTAVLLWRGRPRTRFFVAWIFVTIAPASFFTWGNASRYLYLPAAGFALLLADLIVQAEIVARTWIPRRMARAAAIAVAGALAVRFAVFAEKSTISFRERTRPYERLVEAIRRENPAVASGGSAHVDAADLEDIPEMYRHVAASAAFCKPNIHLVVR
jgi:hypothetical protein